MQKPSTEKRLFRYALGMKKTIIIGLLCVLVAAGLELTGPFIAKKVIDDHIVGVANHYVETDDGGIDFRGEQYVRANRINNESDEKVTLFQDGLSFYFLEEEVSLNAQLVETTNGEYRFDLQGESITASGFELTTSEVFMFFQPEIQPIMWWLALYIGLIILSTVFLYYKTYLLQFASNRIIQRMRKDVFGNVQRVPVSYFVNQPAGKVLARVTNDTEAIRELYVKVLEVFASGAIYMLGIFIALMILDFKLGLICLVLIPIMLIWMKVYKKVGGKYNKVIRETNSTINGNINESVQGMSIIQAYNQTGPRMNEFEELNQKHYDYQIKMNTFTAATAFNLVDLFRNVAFVIFIMYFGGAALDGTSIITAGVLYAFVDYLTRLYEPVEQIISQLPQLEQSRVAGSRVFELLDVEGEDVDDRFKSREIDGSVAFQNVSFAYEKDDYVLRHVDFDIRPGETAAFVGHTGSGKSTIMNLLFRFYDPTHGQITIDGDDIGNYSRQEIRSHIGIVLQDPFIFSGTIISNITMNDPNISREDAIQALKAVGADQFIEALPEQYDQPVKEKGSEFSTGQRQLLSFARALAFNPSILVLDEATANIDTETEGMIQKALQVLKKGRTTLVIAHRLSTIQQADQIFVLKHGKIIERGNHESLLQANGEYFKMYEMQLGKKERLNA
ncbi:multidrug ABC transporter permease [Halalkalibacillus sediminis]|uniref:Multidrug ABC transporter permease n=1 Tax=Halalkalibacillus sediminis TaxID=2018042 RepID=A0A2I0QV68_9BACI|nr:ABC transporter ATP-binding protein [Halalkalibacillus sediminis]PKR78237.1 multidrug ABC transporter permease [Halalkalibacillus sediminis]